MKKKYYITTPIYYPSGTWHLGTCYTTVVCDALARFKRMSGYEVFYLTGTDEHGMKIEKKAKELGMDTKLFLDKQIDSLKELWALLDISYDKFIRTTDDCHKAAVQKIFTKLYEKGDIYKGEYEGWYCTPCESFWTKSQLAEGKCPDCGREVELTKESSYFFRLSKYQDRLIELIEKNTEFLQPKSRQNEMLNNFLRAGLSDLAVSRTSFKWGIPVPFDLEHVIYVWVDALTNYITALGYLSDDQSLFEKFWPAELHMMGKEIVRFHSIIWPALLMALDIPLPKQVYGHGWITLGGDKISKSKGNIVDPVILSGRYGVDSVRYYLLRELPFGSDGMYTNYAYLSRINADLCNSLGNLLSRSTAMVNQYFDGILPAPKTATEFDGELIGLAEGLFLRVSGHMDKLLVPEALQEIFTLIGRANKYIDETAPWVLAKMPEKRDTLATVLYNLCETLRLVGTLLLPFLPRTGGRILSDLSVEMPGEFLDAARFGVLQGGERIIKSEPLFRRVQIDKELLEMEKLANDIAHSAEKNKAAPEQEKKAVEQAKKEGSKECAEKPEITIDQFSEISLRVGRILTAERAENSKKLLKFTVDTGDRVRSIVSGVAKWYTPEELLGKEVVVVVNLKAATIGGHLSEGMILFADDKDGVAVVSPARDVPAGSTVS